MNEYITIDGQNLRLKDNEIKAIEKMYGTKKLSFWQRLFNRNRNDAVFLFEKDLIKLRDIKNILIIMNSDLKNGIERQRSIYDEETIRDFLENFNREFNNVKKRFDMLSRRYLTKSDSSLLENLDKFLKKSLKALNESQSLI